MLWLTIILGTDQEYARLMNLMFFIPCALSATLLRWKDGAIRPLPALITIAAGCTGSVLGNLWRHALDLNLVRKVFGLFFLVCGLKELLYRPRKAR